MVGAGIPSAWGLLRRDSVLPLAGFLLVFALFVWLFAAVVWWGTAHFAENGAEVSGTVTRVHRYTPGEWGVHVDYTEPDGTARSHVFETGGSRADMPAVGDRIDFLVVPGGAVLHFQSDRGGAMAPVLAGMGALMLGGALWVLGAARTRARRLHRLLSRGVPVEAEVLGLRRDRDGDTARIVYAYYLESGTAFRGETRARPAADLRDLRQGDVIDILVDPEAPRESVWPPDALPGVERRTSATVSLVD